MAKVRENLPLPVRRAREEFAELRRLRAEGKAEALRRLEQQLLERSTRVKALVVEALAGGVKIHELVKETGMSRQTVSNYRREYMELMGYESLDEARESMGVENVDAESEVSDIEVSEVLGGTSYTKDKETIYVIEGEIGNKYGGRLPKGIPAWFIEEVPPFLRERGEDEAAQKIEDRLNLYRENGRL